jgi:protein gp37
MGQNSKIEWTDATWPIVAGCEKVSPGCRGCYAVRDSWRLAHHPNPRVSAPYAGTVEKRGEMLCWTGLVRPLPERLEQPLRWAKPRRIFVNSMSDLFHQGVPDEFIDDVFGVMWACLWGRNGQPGHVFQVLTKRADRMRDYLRQDRQKHWAHAAVHYGGGIDPDGIWDQVMGANGPHPRIWLGVSVEDQKAADERIPLLLQTPAAVRWISAEPLLGPVDLTRVRWEGSGYFANTLKRAARPASMDWVVVGGESGPNARPMHPEWARSLRDQCQTAGVAFFFKQFGEWAPTECKAGGDLGGDIRRGNALMARTGKRTAGRLLDGMTWDQYPEVRP